ncbi:MAG TPA: hypothetical protein VK147_01055 [Candidatus Didemnitutus sp.]|nr:hypothetical protein [Candidatus Didemnitutus sp.]
MNDVHGYRAGRRVDADLYNRLRTTAGAVHTATSAVVWSGKAPYQQLFQATIIEGVVRLSVDAYEQRRLYWRLLEDEGGIEFASRIDLLSRHSDTLCLEALACQWTLFTSVSKRTLFNEIQRVPSGMELRYDGETLTFHPLLTPVTIQDPDSALRTALRNLGSSNVVLGLSGGFDSRTLMAALHGANVPFSAHTYGTLRMPDVQRAREVCDLDGVPVRISELNNEVWKRDDVLASIKQTAWQTEGSYPGIHALVFDNATERLGHDSVLVDGAYGALLRGGFGNGLLASSYRALCGRDAAGVIDAMRVRDFSLLNRDIQHEAELRVVNALQMALEEMPGLNRGNSRDWIDEFFVRWYTRGFAASPQAVYDARLHSAMTFLDESVVRSVFSRGSRFRRSGRWFRRLITTHRPVLRSRPMVGKKCDVPWSCAGRPLATALWSKFAPHYPTQELGSIEQVFYPLLRPVILDLAGSSSHPNSDVWDRTAVERLATKTTASEGSDADRASLLLWLGHRMMSDDLV